MTTHGPWKELGYAAGGLALLLALYVGTYFATVSKALHVEYVTVTEEVPYTFIVMTPEGAEPRTGTHVTSKVVPNPPVIVAKYRFADALGLDRMRSFFAPIHGIDRRMRADFWNDPSDAVPPPRPPAPPPPDDSMPEP